MPNPPQAPSSYFLSSSAPIRDTTPCPVHIADPTPTLCILQTPPRAYYRPRPPPCAYYRPYPVGVTDPGQTHLLSGSAFVHLSNRTKRSLRSPLLVTLTCSLARNTASARLWLQDLPCIARGLFSPSPFSSPSEAGAHLSASSNLVPNVM